MEVGKYGDMNNFIRINKAQSSYARLNVFAENNEYKFYDVS
tara:strand:+ start:85 stop:207 length:123 start_codon:yes stop_codon:yes gene_type:complete